MTVRSRLWRLLAALPFSVFAAAAAADTLDAQLQRGAVIYAQVCAVCHGADGEGASAFPNPIIDGGNLAKFAHGLGLYRYTRMMMPFDDPGSLDAGAVWDVTAYLLHANGWLDGLAEPVDGENAEVVAIPPR